jgi:hypothetical protein
MAKSWIIELWKKIFLTTKTIASPFEGGGKWEFVWEKKN